MYWDNKETRNTWGTNGKLQKTTNMVRKQEVT